MPLVIVDCEILRESYEQGKGFPVEGMTGQRLRGIREYGVFEEQLATH